MSRIGYFPSPVVRADQTRVTLFQRHVYQTWLDVGLTAVSAQDVAQEADLPTGTVRTVMVRCCERGWSRMFPEPLPLGRRGRPLLLFQLTRQGALQMHRCLERPRRRRG